MFANAHISFINLLGTSLPPLNSKKTFFFAISFKKFANIQRFKFVPVFVVNVNHDVVTPSFKKLYSETVSSKNHPRRPQPELWQSLNRPDRHGQNQWHIPHGGQAAKEKYAGFCRCLRGMGEAHSFAHKSLLWQKWNALCLSLQYCIDFKELQPPAAFWNDLPQRLSAHDAGCRNLCWLHCGWMPPWKLSGNL